MTFSIQRWDFPSLTWLHTWTCEADNTGHAIRQGRQLGLTCRIRAVVTPNGPEAGVAPLSLPFKPTSDPTFSRPKGYQRPPSPAARRKHRNPR